MAALNSETQSDYSDASITSLGRSLQADYDNISETTPLRGVSVQHLDVDRTPGSSWHSAVFLVVNAALGAGLLNFPAAYHECGGIAVAISTQAVLAVFIFASIIILIYCAQVHSSATYQDVVFSCCGRFARVCCSLTIALYTFGTCITFLIIIGDQWDKFLSLVYGPTFCLEWYMTRYFTISVTSIAFILPLCFPRRIDFLTYASMGGVVAVLYCVALVTVKYFTITEDAVKCPIRYRPETWMDIFTVVPVICFGYQCHVSIVPIFACTRDRRLSKFTKTIVIALTLCFLSYTVTASFGYLTFGSCVKPDILLSYKPTPDVLVAVIIIAIKMYTTYPILLYVGRVAVDSIWQEVSKRRATVNMETLERRRRIVLTVVWFTATLLIALFVPNIGVVISLLGGLAAIFIFVFPGVCLLQLVLSGDLDPVMCWPRYITLMTVSVICLVLGGFIFGLTTTQSLLRDFAGSARQ